MREVARPLLLLLVLIAGCGSGGAGTKAPFVEDGDALPRCFAAAYDTPNIDSAIARCEQEHFGTEWRKPSETRRAGDGDLDPRLIQAGIRARFPRIRACYHAGFKRDPTLKGEFRVRFMIDANGHAVQVFEDAGSKLRDKRVTSCILGEFSALHFPPPEGGGTVTTAYPMVFAPGD
jgi:hypothetical protein